MEKIRARMIFEVLGRPAEHVKEALNTMVIKLGSEKDIEVLEKNYHEPKKIEESDDLFSTFAEVELEVPSIERYFGILFSHFPSNVEVLSPRNFKLGNEDFNAMSNALIAKLHEYDAVSKKLLNERKILLRGLEKEGIDFIKKLKDASEKKAKEK